MTLGIVQIHMSYQCFHHRSVGKESACNTSSIPGLRRSTGDGIGYSLQYSWASLGKESACNAGDLGLIPGLGRSHGEGKGYPFQYSGLENSMDRPWRHKESDMTERLSRFTQKVNRRHKEFL